MRRRARSRCLERAAASVPGVAASPPPYALVTAYRDSGIRYRAYFWIDDYADRLNIESRVLAYVWQAFQRNNIEIPYPVRVMRRAAPDRETPEQIHADIRQCLARIDFLSGLSPAEIERLAGSVQRRVYLPGETVVREGEAGEELFYIDRGDAAITAHTAAGSQPVVKLSAGQYFGEMSLLTGAPRAATVTAETELQVLVVGRRIMQELLAANPMLAEHMGETLMERQGRWRAPGKPCRRPRAPLPPPRRSAAWSIASAASSVTPKISVFATEITEKTAFGGSPRPLCDPWPIYLPVGVLEAGHLKNPQSAQKRKRS